MSQLNLQLTPGFEEDLRLLMQIRGIRTKSEAVRSAVAEALAAARSRKPSADFAGWIGLARLGRENARPRFASDGDLW